MHVRSMFNYDADIVSYQEGIDFRYPEDEEKHPSRSRTQQNMKNECDINVIVSRFIKTGTSPDIPMPTTVDFTESVTDFQTAMNMVVEAQRSFMTLPSEVRDYFANDPQKFLNFVEKHDNFHDAVRLGIAEVRKMAEAPEPVAVRVIPDPQD